MEDEEVYISLVKNNIPYELSKILVSIISIFVALFMVACGNEPKEVEEISLILKRSAGILGVVIDEETKDFDTEEMKSAGYCIWDVKPGTYVVFDCVGEDGDCISNTWSKFYKEFLPQMGYEAEEATDYEIYFERGRTGLFCELWIPVKKKV